MLFRRVPIFGEVKRTHPEVGSLRIRKGGIFKGTVFR